MLIDGKRALAYVVSIDEIKPIDGYDRVEYARTNGWWVVISKNDNLHVGDKCVYFEIDSRVPDTDKRFDFLESKHYKIKTQKMCKVVSQGLLMPLDKFPEFSDAEINTDVTERLGVTYSVAEDNIRKRNVDPNIKYRTMGARHPKLFKTSFIKWCMKHKFGRRILFAIFGKPTDKPLQFPDFVKKTDEERVENQPWRVGDGKTYVLTEKLDGTSSTYALKRNKKDYEFYVCSRNVCLRKNSSIYWEMAIKYNIEEYLRKYLEMNNDEDWVYIQGESVGNVQGNPLKLDDNDLYIFNFVTSKCGRLSTLLGMEIISEWNMKWVPIIEIGTTQDNMEELKSYADGKSLVNPNVLREGIVYRSADGKESFKNVSRKYLLKQK